MKQQTSTYILKTDRERLGNLIELVRNRGDRGNLAYVRNLEDELEFAEVVATEDIPPDVVTMRSRVRLRDLDRKEESVYEIVFPSEANTDEGKISVLAPLATALLGNRRGDTVEFQAADYRSWRSSINPSLRATMIYNFANRRVIVVCDSPFLAHENRRCKIRVADSEILQ